MIGWPVRCSISLLAESAATLLTATAYPSGPCRGPAAASPGRVEGLVDQLVRARVLGSGDAADPPCIEPAQRRDRLGVERPQRRVLDLVGAGELARDELGVVHDLHLAGA